MKASVRLEGAEKVSAALAELVQRATSTILVRAALAGAEPIRLEMKTLVPKRTGELAEGIAASVESHAAKRAVVIVGPSKKHHVGRFLEFGTKKMSARPWARPALERKKAEALVAMNETIWGELAKVRRALS